MVEEQKTERVQLLMTPSEVKAVDDWSFSNRVRGRSEAIRRLIELGLEAARQQLAMEHQTVLESGQVWKSMIPGNPELPREIFRLPADGECVWYKQRVHSGQRSYVPHEGGSFLTCTRREWDAWASEHRAELMDTDPL